MCEQVLLDEVSSALDEEAEAALYAAVAAYCPTFISLGKKQGTYCSTETIIVANSLISLPSQVIARHCASITRTSSASNQTGSISSRSYIISTASSLSVPAVVIFGFSRFSYALSS